MNNTEILMVLLAFSVGVVHHLVNTKWNKLSVLVVSSILVVIGLAGIYGSFYWACAKTISMNIIIKYSFFLYWLFMAADEDIRKREIDNFYPIAIFISALFGIYLTDLPGMLLSAVCIPLPMLIAAIKKPGSIGGGDIKLTSACAFMLGFSKGLFALIISLVISVIGILIRNKIQKKDKKESFAMAPYLAMGNAIACFI